MSDMWRSATIREVLEQCGERGDSSDTLLSVTARQGVIRHEESGRRDTSNADKSKYLRVHAGDIVYNTMRMWQGVSAVSWLDGIVSPAYTVCRPINEADSRFLAHLLKLPKYVVEFKKRSQGLVSDTWNLKYSAFSQIQIEFPCPPEQRRIADILDTLDDQIRATEQIVAKLRAARKGMLEDLISQGTPESVLGDGLAGSPANGIYKPASMIGRGELLIGQTAFTDDRLVNPSLARMAVVSHAELRRFGVANGDILVSRVFATLSGVGQPAYVDSLTQSATFESNMMRLRANPARADDFFLFQLLQTERARSHITRNANLSNQASISQGVLTSMPVFLPTLSEQRRIAQILRVADLRRNAYSRELAKLILTKNALMSDLLAGRVRVSTEAAS